MSETTSFDTGALTERLGSDDTVQSRLLTAAGPRTSDMTTLGFATYVGIPSQQSPHKATSEQGAWRRNGTVCRADSSCSGIVFSQTQLHATLPQFVNQKVVLKLEGASQYTGEVVVVSQPGFKIQCVVYGYPDIKVTMIEPAWWLQPVSSNQQTYRFSFSNEFVEASVSLVFVVAVGGIQGQRIYAVDLPKFV